MLRPYEVPSLKLSSLCTHVVVLPPRRALVQYERIRISHHVTDSEETTALEEPEETHCDAAMNTDLTMDDINELEKQLNEVKKDLKQVKDESEMQLFRVENTGSDDNKVKYYSGFSTFSVLIACLNFLGPSVNKFIY